MREEGTASYATSPVHQAFCRATAQVEAEMSELIADEGGWEEEYITRRLFRAVRPEVRYALFNRQQEGRVAADYLWWWVDRSGECFGCLIQAKNIKRRGRRWQIDFRRTDPLVPGLRVWQIRSPPTQCVHLGVGAMAGWRLNRWRVAVSSRTRSPWSGVPKELEGPFLLDGASA